MSGDSAWVRVERTDHRYPARLEALGCGAPPPLEMLGDPSLLGRPLVALFCSARATGASLLPAYDVVRGLRDAGVPVIGGFQSPLERECLELLLRGGEPLVICPARGAARMRVPRRWREATSQGRVLILCEADLRLRRPTAATVQRRNRLVAALSRRVLAMYATPGGRLARLASEAIGWGRPVFCLDIPDNDDLRLAGATALDAEKLIEALASPVGGSLQSEIR